MNDGITVTGVVFGAEAMQIGFVEHRHQSEKGNIEQSLTILTRGLEELVEDVQEVLTEVIDNYMVECRNPPVDIPVGSARSRLKDRVTEGTEE